MLCRTLFGFLILIARAPSVSAADRPPPIRDGAKLFSPEAVVRVTEQIQKIRDDLHLDFVLETTDMLPPEVIDRLDRASNVNRAFGEIALERARTAEMHGIYVYICNTTKPRYRTVAVVVWPPELRESFSDRRREKVRKLFAENLEKHPDDALKKAVEYVLEHADAESSWFGWGTVAIIVGAGLGLWLILGLIRMRMNATRPGIVPGLLGGMFGAMAGHWIYDTFLHNSPAATPHPDPAKGDESTV